MNYNSNFILDLFQAMARENIICAYHGDFNYEVVNGILINVKQDLNKPNVDRRTAKKTYKVLVECLENIYKHSSSRKEENGITTKNNEGIFILSNDEQGYHIIVGNLVSNDDVDGLTANFDEVNNMSKEELKEKYRNIIRKTEISEKGGAGLGIVDMALKSESTLNYSIHDYSDKLKFLTLEITINY